MTYDLLKELKEKRKTYAEMVDFCCGDQLILNNSIVEFMNKNDYYDYEIICGSEKTYYNADGDEISEEEYYETENGNEEYDDIFQYYIITGSAAERFEKYTNELVIYYSDADIYLLCVKHFGTAWSCVSANWKENEGE